MEKDFDCHISDTAFLVNESRARKALISGDRYARAWVPLSSRDRVRQLWDEFSENVYPYDDLELSIRNRFFLDHINRFIQTHRSAVFVNLGAGLTSYPYLMDRETDCYEIDLPHVMEFKQQRAAQLIESGEIPKRNIEYKPLDLGTDSASATLTGWFGEKLGNVPSFVLLEGVSYYLDRRALLSLTSTFGQLQGRGSILALDFWKPDLCSHPVFQRLQTYFSSRFGFESNDYCLIDEAFVESIPEYAVQTITDVSAMEQVYAGSSILADKQRILLENYAVLVKE